MVHKRRILKHMEKFGELVEGQEALTSTVFGLQ